MEFDEYLDKYLRVSSLDGLAKKQESFESFDIIKNDFDSELDTYLTNLLTQLEGSSKPYMSWRGSDTIVEEYNKIIEYYKEYYHNAPEEVKEKYSKIIEHYIEQNHDYPEIIRLKILIRFMIEELENCVEPDGTNLLTSLIIKQNVANGRLNEVLPGDDELKIPMVSKKSILDHLDNCGSILELATIGKIYANKLAHYYQGQEEKTIRDLAKQNVGGKKLTADKERILKEEVDKFRAEIKDELLHQLQEMLKTGGNNISRTDIKDIFEMVCDKLQDKIKSKPNVYGDYKRAINLEFRRIYSKLKNAQKLDLSDISTGLAKNVKKSTKNSKEISEELNKILQSGDIKYSDDEKLIDMMGLFLDVELEAIFQKEFAKRVDEELLKEAEQEFRRENEETVKNIQWRSTLFYNFKSLLMVMSARLLKENYTRGEIALEKNIEENNQEVNEELSGESGQNNLTKKVMGVIYLVLRRKIQLTSIHFTDTSMENTDPVVGGELEPEEDLNPFYRIPGGLSLKVYIPLPDLNEKQVEMFKILSQVCSIIDQEVDDDTRKKQIEEYLNSLDNEEWKRKFKESGTIENLIDKWKQEKEEQEKKEAEKEETEKVEPKKKKEPGQFSMLKILFDIGAGEYSIISQYEFMRRYLKLVGAPELREKNAPKEDRQKLNHRSNEAEEETTSESTTQEHGVNVFAEGTDMADVSDAKKSFLRNFKESPQNPQSEESQK